MNTILRLGSALLLVVLIYLNPIGGCAEKLQAQSAPQHKCCPQAPSQAVDCATIGCACAEPELVLNAVAMSTDVSPLLVAEVGPSASAPPLPGNSVVSEDLLRSDQRFITFHQLRI